MEKEVILVPKDKSPMDVLTEMGERIRNSWIFLHENVYQHLLESEGTSITKRVCCFCDGSDIMFKWGKKGEISEKYFFMDIPPSKGWGRIRSIHITDIAYKVSPVDPENIFFLKMAE